MEGLFEQIAFWVLAVITVFSALMVTTLNNLSRAVVFLVFFFLGGSGLYFLLNADFLALMQIMIYAGAIAVLFAFVIMMTPKIPGTAVKQSINQWAGALLGGIFLIFMFIVLATTSSFKSYDSIASSASLKDLGQLLLGKYLLPFELVSVLLLVALIASIIYTNVPQKEDISHESD